MINDNCPHQYVHREEGYEEECIPVICTICGDCKCLCAVKDKGRRNAILYGEKGISFADWKKQITPFTCAVLFGWF